MPLHYPKHVFIVERLSLSKFKTKSMSMTLCYCKDLEILYPVNLLNMSHEYG